MMELISFSEWYHYAVLFLWLLLLLLVLRNIRVIEQFFKPKEGFVRGERYSLLFLSYSFILGFLFFLAMLSAPAGEQSVHLFWNFMPYGFFGLVLLLVLLQIRMSFQNYEPSGLWLRITGMTLLMVVFFFSGVFGGLSVVGIVALLIVFLAFRWLKRLLT